MADVDFDRAVQASLAQEAENEKLRQKEAAEVQRALTLSRSNQGPIYSDRGASSPGKALMSEDEQLQRALVLSKAQQQEEDDLHRVLTLSVTDRGRVDRKDTKLEVSRAMAALSEQKKLNPLRFGYWDNLARIHVFDENVACYGVGGSIDITGPGVGIQVDGQTLTIFGDQHFKIAKDDHMFSDFEAYAKNYPDHTYSVCVIDGFSGLIHIYNAINLENRMELWFCGTVAGRRSYYKLTV